MSIELTIRDGQVLGIYTDDFDFAALGEVLGSSPEIRRASNVEPDAAGRWVADMALSGGPKLAPQAKRGDALAAEVEWLRRNAL